MPRLIILDFDGTFTDAEEEGKPFTEGCINGVSIRLRVPIVEVRESWATFTREIAGDPITHPYMRNGYAVAPANADPYLRMGEIVRMIFGRFGVMPIDGDFTGVVNDLFAKNYGKGDVVFKPDAGTVLKAFAGQAAYVVTNSATEKVSAKIETLGWEKHRKPNSLAWLLPRVHGLARKFDIVPDFDRVHESMELPDLPRPVLLRRGHYYKVINDLRVQHGVAWENVTVVGDNFELDLCLPIALGAEVVLVPNENTPDYERAFVAAHERGHVVHDLKDLLPLLAI